MPLRIAPVLLLLLPLAVAGGARAQDGARPWRVSLHVEDCLGADAVAVRRIAAAELGDVLVGIEVDRAEAAGLDRAPGAHPADPGPGPAVLVVRAECGVEGSVVRAWHPATGVRLERRVDLARSAENARSRLLALSIAELAAAALAEVEALPPAEVAPPEAPAPAEEPSPPGEPAAPPATPPAHAPPPMAGGEEPAPPGRPIGLRLVGVARVSGTPTHVSAGLGLGLEVALAGPVAVGGDLRYEQGSVDAADLGAVSLRVAWATLLAMLQPLVGWSSLSVGVGAKVGVAWLEGLGPSGLTHSAPIFGPALAGHMALHLAGSGYLHVGLELAWITRGATGVDRRSGAEVASFEGPQLAVTAGFEIQPGR